MTTDAGPSVDIGASGGQPAPAGAPSGGGGADVSEASITPGKSTSFGARDILDFLDVQPESGDENGEEESGEKKTTQANETELLDGEGSEETEGEDASADKKADAPRVLKFKNGDKAIDLADNSEVQVTVDGKKENVAVRDLIKNYAGKVGWEKKFQSLAEERKAFVKDVETVDRKLERVFGLLSKGDIARGLQELYDMKGEKIEGDPIDHFVKQAKKNVEEYEKLTPEQRKLKAEEIRLQREREDFEKQKNEETRTKAQKDADDYVKNQVEIHKVTPDLFNNTWGRLQAARTKMMQAGKSDPFKGLQSKDLTDLVIGRIHLDRHENNIQSVISSVDSAASSDLTKQIFGIISEFERSENRVATKDEIELVAREILGAKTPKKLKAGATKPTSKGRSRQSSGSPAKLETPPDGKSDVAEGGEDYSSFGGLLRTLGANSGAS